MISPNEPLYCPKCKMENLTGATECAFCQTALDVNPRTEVITSQVSDLPEGETTEWVPREIDIPLQQGIIIYVNKQSETLIIEKKEPFILGRNVENSRGRNGEEIIDLSGYDAYVKGVSRQHVKILPVEGEYVIIDMGSTNGTWLNQLRLIPGRFYQLERDNEVRLGHLSLKIIVRMPRKSQTGVIKK